MADGKDEQAELLKKLMQTSGKGVTPEEKDDEPAPEPPADDVPPPAPAAEEEDEGLPEGPGFMALYTTLMLLLMTFFIVLCSMNTSSPSNDKFKMAKKSLKKSMGLMGMEGSRHALFFMHSVLKIQNTVISDAMDDHREEDTIDDDAPSGDGTGGGFWEDGVSKTEARQLDKFVRMGFSITPYDKNKKFVKVQFPMRGVFQEGSDMFEETFEGSLAELSELLQGSYSKVIVEVFTIETPQPDLGIVSSKELAAVRAYRIADYLRTQTKVATAEVHPIGYGEYYVGHPDIDTAKNEMIIMKVFDLWSAGGAADAAASQT